MSLHLSRFPPPSFGFSRRLPEFGLPHHHPRGLIILFNCSCCKGKAKKWHPTISQYVLQHIFHLSHLSEVPVPIGFADGSPPTTTVPSASPRRSIRVRLPPTCIFVDTSHTCKFVDTNLYFCRQSPPLLVYP